MENLHQQLIEIGKTIDGEILLDNSSRLIYATDASAYREKPLAVCYPQHKKDILKLIHFARENKTSIIPRTAGTSLAGQVVGGGIVADVSKYMTGILEVNEKEKWVRVQPGVILDELNKFLAPKGLFFGPETSTSNRCMLGGMLGNNACGARSLVYGSTRDHTLEVTAFLSDGSEAVFKSLSNEEFQIKFQKDSLEGRIYQQINELLSNVKNQEEIQKEYPDKSLKRRNTGYAIDLLLDQSSFAKDGPDFNFCTLLAGSEGTLAFTTEIKLNLVPLPPPEKVLVCVHLNSVAEALEANLLALKHSPRAIELMDSVVLNLTKENIAQKKNRFFLKGKPGALLIVEFAEETNENLKARTKAMVADMRRHQMGSHYPEVYGPDIPKVWNLRKAGLGVLNNMPGDGKPVPVVEDTAVSPDVLPEYINEFDAMLKRHGKACVYYAHIATGELHLRPILNLKDPKDVELFHTIAKETAHLVKKYKGSLSGEHGDGRLRGEFIPVMIGEHNYQLLKDIKKTWDSNGIFNPGKIVDTPKMNSSLRFQAGKTTPEIETFFDFSKDLGIVRSAEKCNGTAACRKTEVIGGTMCPSYMASRDEAQSTRARANILREFLNNSPKKNPFNHKEIFEVMDMCLSCKACKSECPSSVDVAKMKAEFLQHYYRSNGIPLRTHLIANFSKLNSLAALVPWKYNYLISNSFCSKLFAQTIGFAPQRQLPLLAKQTLSKWFAKQPIRESADFPNGKVFLFNDEFTNYNDTDIGIKAVRLLTKLGYRVEIPKHVESARTYLSKGLVKKAKYLAIKNVRALKNLVNEETPLIGVEPSAILGFRDEYPDLMPNSLIDDAIELGKNALMIDEFLEREMKSGKIKKEQFSDEKKQIKLHGHCHQKSLASTDPTKYILSFPAHYAVEEIPSGCCGMAGSFGFEQEHYEMSMKIGELVLFPAVRDTSEETLIAAPGTSCRHQIKDGTQRTALHPVEILFDALL